MTPSVNIIITAYNQAEYLAQAIQSALDQDYENLHVIVSDDASSDSTKAVIENFLPNQKLSVNRNAHNLGRVANYRKCLNELSFSDWVLILDGDDYLIDRSYVSRAIEVASHDPAIDLVFANAARLREDLDNRVQASHENQGLPDILEGADLFLRLATEKISLFHNTCLYKRQKACAIGFFQQDIIGTDWECLHRYILTGKVAFFAINAAIYRRHDNNVTKALSAKQRRDNLKNIVGPYQAAKNSQIFPEIVLEAWLEKMLWKAATNDLRALLKMLDLQGYKSYIEYLDAIHPVVSRRIRNSPDMLARNFRARLKIFRKFVFRRGVALQS